jgi:hypothetical protein
VTPEFPSIITTGRLSSCCAWDDYICTPQEQNPEKIGKYCISWKWSARTSTNSRTAVTWSSTKSNRSYNKKWVFEPCVTQDGSILIGSACEEGVWNVNIEKINTYYDPIVNCTVNSSCAYKDIVSRNNILYVALTNEVKVLSSDYSGTFVASRLLLDDLFGFRDIRGIALDSQNKLFVLDGTLNRVASYNINLTDPVPFDLFLSWGGFGTSKSTQGFSKPNDICIDNFDNVWIADTGNKCVKGYSNTGTWLITIIDSSLRTTPPISITTDSENNLHCLTQTGVRVYNQQGTFIFEYSFTDTVSEEAQPIKINSNYNKEIIYIVFSNTVARYFRNGVYAGRLIDNKTCATNIQDVYQDEFRNTLVVSGDKILKYVDLMELKSIKGPLPESYWPLSNLFIHKDEYVQNWVYNKSFQRLWDNIELFRGSLIFDETKCKSYKPPTYSKEQIVIGQNEIVTSAVVNRSIEYLWSNFESLLSYFDPDCNNNNNNLSINFCTFITPTPTPTETPTAIFVPFDLVWSTTVDNPCDPNPWVISGNNTSIRYNVVDSSDCGGTCNEIQSGTATANITVGSKDVDMYLTFSGIGELEDPDFELISFSLNGNELATGNAAGGDLGCEMGPIVQNIIVPGPYRLNKNENYTFFIDFTTNDQFYHVGCYYQINLSFVEIN